jgi:hypothetical protein
MYGKQARKRELRFTPLKKSLNSIFNLLFRTLEREDTFDELKYSLLI